MVFVLGLFKRNSAAIARKPREPLVIEEVIVAAPKPREVRIKIICTSLCHSDINYWKLERHPVIFPRKLGHEAIRVVESIGEGVHEVVDGDTVILMFLPDCGECADCLSKKSNICSKYPLHCTPWVADGARICGAKKIIGVDVNQDKFEIGTKFGVTNFVNPQNIGDKNVSQVIIEMTGGGADYCFECVGLTSLVHEAYASSRKGWGKTVMLGVDQPEAMLTLSSFELLDGEKSLTGYWRYKNFQFYLPSTSHHFIIRLLLQSLIKLERHGAMSA